MGAYTFYNDDEINSLISSLEDIELRQLIEETNKSTNQLFFAREYTYYKKRYFKKSLKKTLYSLYVKVSNGEAKCINFARPSDVNGSSLNYDVDKSLVITYLFGVLTGAEYNEKQFLII